MEIARGKAFIFFGSFIAHSVVEIEGRRSVIDRFAYKSVFVWWEGINRGLTTIELFRAGNHRHHEGDDEPKGGGSHSAQVSLGHGPPAFLYYGNNEIGRASTAPVMLTVG